MPMRDLLLLAIVIAGCVASLKRPWIGVMLWTWLSVMNPHRYVYGFAYSAPLAAVTACAILVGLLKTNERESPFKGAPITILVVFMAWMTLSWLVGLDVAGDYPQWKKVMKIDGMLLVALMVLHSKKHIMALMWVCVVSIGLLAMKGGIFTLSGGGGGRVYGPEGSFIGDNNTFALAVVMTIPLMRFVQLQVQSKLASWALTGAMLLSAASALGSQSRGAFLAIGATAFTLWWRGKRKFGMAFLLVAAALPLLNFMPEEWWERMNTIGDDERDSSVQGRFSAWWVAWNLASVYPAGVGFNTARASLFAQFSPTPELVHAAHSIYFQILGNHGFIGLFIYLGIWISTWRYAGWLRTRKNLPPEAKWTADLGAMCQVSLVAYATGGAFLSLAYFDLPYIIMVIVVLTRIWVEKQSWKTEPVENVRWMQLLGLSAPGKAT